MEKTIECRSHERVESTGESQRGVSFHPIVRGSRFFLILSDSRVFLMGFNAFGTKVLPH